jgi:hypothetical protein
MNTKITWGGRVSLILCAVFVAAWLPILLSGGESDLVVEGCLMVIMVLSFPLGWMTGYFSGHGGGESALDVIRLFAVCVGNCFLLGYGITGTVQFFRRLFSPFPTVEYTRESKAEQDGGGQPATRPESK